MRAAMRPTGSRHAVLAGFLGWTLDAFDFFVVVFLLDTLAAAFHVSKGRIIFTLTITLVFRPVGAIIFGLLADRFGRRAPLMANVIYFSVIELLSGCATNFTQFIILRALFGIGMGGEWGVGASLALYIRSKVPESPAWEEHRVGSLSAIGRVVASQTKGFAYLVVLMTFMMFLSHGTQDLFPDFLKHDRGIAEKTVPYVLIIANIG